MSMTTTDRLLRELLALPDFALAALYSEWSEETHAAGWYGGGETMFVKDISTGRYSPIRWGLTQIYEREGVKAIRSLLQEALTGKKEA